MGTSKNGEFVKRVDEIRVQVVKLESTEGDFQLARV
jgi:hypothetical protein